MGPGRIESIEERCLRREFELQGVRTEVQKIIPIHYKGLKFEESLRFDILVDDHLLLELKAVTKVLPIHKAQLFSYMKLLNTPIGLLINFHENRLIDGISRLILPGSNQP